MRMHVLPCLWRLLVHTDQVKAAVKVWMKNTVDVLNLVLRIDLETQK